MKPIGGYFELELPVGQELYPNLIALNSARNALIYVVKAKNIKTLMMPHLNCPVVVDAVRRFCPEVAIQYYHVNAQLVPLLDKVPNAVVLYVVNFFGLQDALVDSLAGQPHILDNAQALYSSPLPGIDTIYCPRKFLGIGDGGFLSTNTELRETLDFDTSWRRSGFLMRRIDCGPSDGYDDFRKADSELVGQPLRKMSNLTKRILSGIDHSRIKTVRHRNFAQIHARLGEQNALRELIERAMNHPRFVPFFYPFMTKEAAALRARLIANKVFIPVFWPDLKASTELHPAERRFVEDVVSIPVDQRYGESEMSRILELVGG